MNTLFQKNCMNYARMAAFMGALASVFAISTPIAANNESVLSSVSLPVSFEKNQGQVSPSVDYLSRGAGYTLFVSGNKAEFAFNNWNSSETETHTVSLSILNSQNSLKVEGLEQQAGHINYMLGNNPDAWLSNIPLFSELQVKDVYPGIDLRYLNDGERLEYDFIVHPGSDGQNIELGFDGIDSFRLDDSGALVLETGVGPLIHRAPFLYQEVNGNRQQVNGRFELRSSDKGNFVVGFEIDQYDTSLPLVIDPVVEFSTYLGANLGDSAAAVAIDDSNNIYVTGATDLFVPGPNNPNRTVRRTDAFVSKFSPDGQTLIYSTLIGGSEDEGNPADEVDSGDKGIVVDASGHAYITGTTESEDFPLLNAAQSVYGGGSSDAYVLKLSADGSNLIYSTFLGGNRGEQGNDLALTPTGTVVVVGSTRSDTFPVVNPIQVTGDLQLEAFISELNATGDSVLFSSYLGGDRGDEAKAVAVDVANNIYVGGATRSRNRFPATDNVFTSGYQGGGQDGFVVKLLSDRSDYSFALNLGGVNNDIIEDLVLASNGDILVTGSTSSDSTFPITSAAFQPSYGGGDSDAFFAKISNDGGSLLMSTYLGDNRLDIGYGIAQAADDTFWLTGITRSRSFPEVDPLQVGKTGGPDAFISQFAAAGDLLLFSTYYGGNNKDTGSDLAIDSNGSIVVVGMTQSDQNFPLTNAMQTARSGPRDAFILKLTTDNSPPNIDSDPVLDALVGVLYSYQVEASDPDDDVLSYSLLDFPLGMTIDAISGLVEWLPDLEGDFTVEIEVTDTANNSVTQSFTVSTFLDTVAPIITVASPVNDSVTNLSLQTLIGQLSEQATLTVNGNAVAVAEDLGFELDVVLVEEGNSFSFSAVDASGNVGVLDYSLVLDSLAPVVTFTSPQNNQFTNIVSTTLTGSISELSTLEINGSSVPVDATTLTFSFETTLLEGLNEFVAIATDAAGNVGQTELIRNLDIFPPQLLNLSPVDGFITSESELTLSGSLSEIAILTINGLATEINQDLSFNTVVTLTEGSNSFDFLAVDRAGNSASETRVVTLDTLPLEVSILSPAPVSVTNQPVLTVTGQVSKLVDLIVNGQAVTQATDFSFAADVNLLEGLNTIELIATDSNGDSETLTLQVTLDATAPTSPDLTLISRMMPLDGQISIEGAPASVEPGSLVNITNPINNEVEIVVASADGTFAAQIAVNQNEAVQLLTKDSAGNQSAVVSLSAFMPANLTIQPIANRTAEIGQQLNFNVVAYNLGDVPITYDIGPLPLPAGIEFDRATGEFAFTPDSTVVGVYQLTVTASDARDNVSESVTLTVPAPSAADPTELRGRVLDAQSLSEGTLLPVIGAEVTYSDANRNVLATSISDINGEFSLSNIPLEAEFLMISSGSAQKAPDGSSYASFEESLTPLLNVSNIIDRPFSLPRILPENEAQVIVGEATVVTNPATGAELVVPPDSAVWADGSPFLGKLSINQVATGFEPTQQSDGSSSLVQFTIQPLGVEFSNPVQLSFPNVYGIESGTQLGLFSNLKQPEGSSQQIRRPQRRSLEIDFNLCLSITGSILTCFDPFLPLLEEIYIFILVNSGNGFIDESNNTNSNDENFVTVVNAADTPRLNVEDGVGRSGYYNVNEFAPLPLSPTNESKTCGGHCEAIGSTVSLEGGDLGLEINLPVYRSLETDWEHTLVYQSSRAYPNLIIPVIGAPLPGNPVPDNLELKVAFEGILGEPDLFPRPNEVDRIFQMAKEVNVEDFPTGVYSYTTFLESEFSTLNNERNRAVRRSVNEVQVVNERGSAFGAGWMLRGHYRLVLDDTDPYREPALLVSPEGGAITYRAQTIAGSTGVIILPGQLPKSVGTLSGTYASPPSDFSTLTRDTTTNTFVHRSKNGTEMHFDSSGFLTQREDRNGNAALYAYDNSGRLESITDPAQLETLFTYGPDGLLDSIQDPAERITTFDHDEFGNLKRTEFPDNSFVEHTYDDRNLLLTRKDERDNSTTYTFDEQGKLKSVTLPDGNTRAATNQRSNALAENSLKPANIRQATFTDARGKTSTIQLDSQSRPVARTDELGRITEHVRDADGNPTQTTRPNGSVITREFDLNGNLLRHREEFNEAETRFTYDSFSLVTSITNPNDHVVTIDRDSNGNPIIIRNALGHETMLVYNSKGLLERSTSPNGLVTGYVYFANDLLSTQTETPPAGSPGNIRVTSFSYYLSGLLETMTTPDGVTLTFGYDTRSRLETVEDNLGQEVVLAYDAAGNIASTETRNGDGSLAQQLLNDYDLRNRLIGSRALHEGLEQSVVQFIPDENGNIGTIIDPSNVSSTNVFDDANRLMESTDRLQGITQFEYNVDDRIERVTAPNGVVTDFTYDVLGRLLTETSSDRGLSSFTYDIANNLLSATDARGVVTTFDYDELERVKSKTFTGLNNGKNENVVYTYDNCLFGLGRLCSRDDESGSYDYDFDAFGNLTRVIHNELGVNYITEYTYDDGDNIASTTLPSGRVVNYGRDAVRRMLSVDTTLNGVNQVIVNNAQYRGDNQLTELTFGNGIIDKRSYDLQGRLLTQELSSGPTSLDSRTYDYDVNSNLESRTGTVQNSSSEYDDLDRLIEDNVSGGQNLSYTYDPNGNRETRDSVDGALAETLTYQSGVSNRLLTRAITQVGLLPEDFTDLNVKTYAYNQANRLYQIKEGLVDNLDPSVIAEYIYNDDGLRTQKILNNEDGSSSTTIYHYDQVGMLISETTDTGELIRDYIWGEGLISLAQIDNDGVASSENLSFLHRDHLLTPRLATDLGQATVWQWEGEAFGETEASEFAGVTVNLRFPGQYFDSESGQHYNWMRNYDPGIGRYTQSDPIGLGGGLNTFSYVANGPVNFTDSTGQFIDILPDIGFIIYDVYRIFNDNFLGDCDNLGENIGALLGDVAGAVLPGVTGVGVGIRAGGAARRGAKSVTPALPPPRVRGNPNTAPENGTIFVDSKGNAIVTPPGGKITGSPDGRFIQARDANSNPTGVRIDGGHSPKTHTDPRALAPHGHVPGVKNTDGTPWLPIDQ